MLSSDFLIFQKIDENQPMFSFEDIKERLKKAFGEKVAEVLAEVISQSYSVIVKVTDIVDLKDAIRQLAEAQRRTEFKSYEFDLRYGQGRS